MPIDMLSCICMLSSKYLLIYSFKKWAKWAKRALIFKTTSLISSYAYWHIFRAGVPKRTKSCRTWDFRSCVCLSPPRPSQPWNLPPQAWDLPSQAWNLPPQALNRLCQARSAPLGPKSSFSNSRPERADFRLERAWRERMEKRTNEWKSPCVLQDINPLGPLPKK